MYPRPLNRVSAVKRRAALARIRRRRWAGWDRPGYQPKRSTQRRRFGRSARAHRHRPAPLCRPRRPVSVLRSFRHRQHFRYYDYHLPDGWAFPRESLSGKSARRWRRPLRFSRLRRKTPNWWWRPRRRRLWRRIYARNNRTVRPNRPGRYRVADRRLRTPARIYRRSVRQRRRWAYRKRRGVAARIVRPRVGATTDGHLWGRPPTVRAFTFRTALIATANNFWGVYYTKEQTNRMEAHLSAGQTPHTAGSRRGTPFAAAAVAGWLATRATAAAVDYQDQMVRPRLLLRWLNHRRRRMRIFRRVRQAWRTRRKPPVLAIEFKNWFPSRRWRTAVNRFYTGLLSKLPRVRLIQAVHLGAGHNGLRGPKRRRV